MLVHGPDASVLLFTEHPPYVNNHKYIYIKKEDDALSKELHYRLSGVLQNMLMSIFTGGGVFLDICQG